MSRMGDTYTEVMEATPFTLEWLIAGTMRVAVVGPFGLVDRGEFVEVYETTDERTDERIGIADNVTSALIFIQSRCQIRL